MQAYSEVPSTPLHTATVLREEEENWQDVKVCEGLNPTWSQSFQPLFVRQELYRYNQVLQNDLIFALDDPYYKATILLSLV